MTYKLCAIVALLFCTTSCGPDWVDCKTCRAGEPSVESSGGGEQIPVVVNVDVDVDVTVTTTTTTTTTTTNNGGDTTNNPGDAGTPPGDAGTPPTCRMVCVRYTEKLRCDQGWHGTDTKGRCTSKKPKKCVEEVLQCS